MRPRESSNTGGVAVKRTTIGFSYAAGGGFAHRLVPPRRPQVPALDCIGSRRGHHLTRLGVIGPTLFCTKVSLRSRPRALGTGFESGQRKSLDAAAPREAGEQRRAFATPLSRTSR